MYNHRIPRAHRLLIQSSLLLTGSSYRGFIKAESGIDAALAHMKAIRDTATKPNSKVAIVGAGLSGVEFAGELKTAFPHAHVCARSVSVLMSLTRPSLYFDL